MKKIHYIHYTYICKLFFYDVNDYDLIWHIYQFLYCKYTYKL